MKNGSRNPAGRRRRSSASWQKLVMAIVGTLGTVLIAWLGAAQAPHPCAVPQLSPVSSLG